MKLTALTLIILLATASSTYADNLSATAQGDIATARAIPVVVHGQPDVAKNDVPLTHIKAPEFKQGNGASNDDSHSKDEEVINMLSKGDTRFINAMKYTMSGDVDYAFLLALSQESHKVYDVLTRLVIIKELARLHVDMVNAAKSISCHSATPLNDTTHNSQE